MLKPSGFGVDFPQFVVRKSTAKYSSSKVDGISTSLVYMLRKKKNINNIKNTILPSSGTHMAVSLWFLSVLHRARLQRGHVLCDHCCQSHGEQMHCHGWGRWVQWCVFGFFFSDYFFYFMLWFPQESPHQNRHDLVQVFCCGYPCGILQNRCQKISAAIPQHVYKPKRQ